MIGEDVVRRVQIAGPGIRPGLEDVARNLGRSLDRGPSPLDVGVIAPHTDAPAPRLAVPEQIRVAERVVGDHHRAIAAHARSRGNRHVAIEDVAVEGVGLDRTDPAAAGAGRYYLIVEVDTAAQFITGSRSHDRVGEAKACVHDLEGLECSVIRHIRGDEFDPADRDVRARHHEVGAPVRLLAGFHDNRDVGDIGDSVAVSIEPHDRHRLIDEQPKVVRRAVVRGKLRVGAGIHAHRAAGRHEVQSLLHAGDPRDLGAQRRHRHLREVALEPDRRWGRVGARRQVGVEVDPAAA